MDQLFCSHNRVTSLFSTSNIHERHVKNFGASYRAKTSKKLITQITLQITLAFVARLNIFETWDQNPHVLGI